MTDAELILAMQSGDEAALAEFYDRYLPSVWRYARVRILGSVQPVEDVVAETFIAAIRAIGRVDPTSVSFEIHGAQHAPDTEIEEFIRSYPLTPVGIIDYLELRRPIYVATSSHGHFGRPVGADGSFSWERISQPTA